MEDSPVMYWAIFIGTALLAFEALKTWGLAAHARYHLWWLGRCLMTALARRVGNARRLRLPLLGL
jgi:hypothetical protein